MNTQEMLVSSHQMLVHQKGKVLLAGKDLGHDAGDERNEVSDGHHKRCVVELLPSVCLRVAC